MTSLKPEELDAWWGSCSVKSTLPGMLLSLAASLIIIGIAWLLPHDWRGQLIVLAILGVCWTALLLRWIYIIFGINYRLTSHRLIVEFGLKRRWLQTVALSTISQVVVKSTGVEKFLGVGRVVLEVQGSSAAPIILAGVAEPDQVAEKIRALSVIPK